MDKQNRKITAETEKRMRIIANLIIDRILEDKRKSRLKFAVKQHIIK